MYENKMVFSWFTFFYFSLASFSSFLCVVLSITNVFLVDSAVINFFFPLLLSLKRFYMKIEANTMRWLMKHWLNTNSSASVVLNIESCMKIQVAFIWMKTHSVDTSNFSSIIHTVYSCPMIGCYAFLQTSEWWSIKY